MTGIALVFPPPSYGQVYTIFDLIKQERFYQATLQEYEGLRLP
jgi:hypothetical protein